MENKDIIKQMEIEHQAEVAAQNANVEVIPDYILNRYRKVKWWRFFPKEFVFKTMGEINGKVICDFGCGVGAISTQLAKLGASVTGVDISPDLIKIAKRRAKINKVENNTKFIAADAEEINLPANTFDFLIAYDLLHHVDIACVLETVIKSLKPNGKAIFVEPIACSRTLAILRDLIPIEKDGSPADRQLNKADLQLISGYFDEYEMSFYLLFGRLARLFPYANKIDRGHYFTKIILLFLNGVDRILISIFPFLWRFYGNVAFVGRKPSSQ